MRAVEAKSGFIAGGEAAPAGQPRLLLFSATPRSDRGGVQRMLDQMMVALPEHGLRVVRLGPDETPETGGIRIVLEAGASASGRPSVVALRGAAGSLVRLATILSRVRPDVVNVHFLTGAVAYFVALRPVFGYRLVLSGHGADLLRPTSAMSAQLPRLLRAADATTVVSEELADAARAFGAPEERLHYIPNGTDTAFWSPAPPAAEPDRIVAAGRLLPIKGFDLLVEALAGLPQARATILGEGEERPALEARIAALGLADRVRLAGHLPPEKLRRELRRASVFAMPSRGEGMPIALLEALACGCPAVAAGVGGIPQVLTKASGIVVPPEDVGALRDGLAAALSGDAPFSRDGARARALQFSEDACFATYAQLVRELVPKRRDRHAGDKYLPPAQAEVSGPVARIRRRLGWIGNRTGQRLVTAGVPPASVGNRWVPHRSATEAAHEVREIHPPRVFSAPLPITLTRRALLPNDPGWWGFSFHDVPERSTAPTQLLSVPQARVLAGATDEGEFSPAVLDAGGSSLDLREIRYRPLHASLARQAPTLRLDSAVWIAERVFDNYSHWFTAHVPKLVLLRDLGLLDVLVLPEGRPAWLDDSLRMLGIHSSEIVELPRGAVLSTGMLTLVSCDRFRPELLQAARDALAAPGRPEAGERIFISRRASHGRRLLDEEGFDPLLREHGFRSVVMERLALEEQIALMAETRVLLAPHGAGLTNMLFCRPGTIVVEIADPDYPNPNFYAMAAALGHEYGWIRGFGQGLGHPLRRDLGVSRAALREVLERLP